MENSLADNVMKALSLTKSHLASYPCPNNINYLWNQGFLLFMIIVFQLISGVVISFQYSTAGIRVSLHSIQYYLKEVYYGWCIQYIHSTGVSLLFGVLFIHIIRGMYMSSYLLSTTTWM